MPAECEALKKLSTEVHGLGAGLSGKVEVIKANNEVILGALRSTSFSISTGCGPDVSTLKRFQLTTSFLFHLTSLSLFITFQPYSYNL